MLATKFGWFRAGSGNVWIEGKPLDGRPARFAAEVGSAAAYGSTVFDPSILRFERPGCWVLRAHLAASVLELVLRVHRPSSSS
jgi:hypothetical protein